MATEPTQLPSYLPRPATSHPLFSSHYLDQHHLWSSSISLSSCYVETRFYCRLVMTAVSVLFTSAALLPRARLRWWDWARRHATRDEVICTRLCTAFVMPSSRPRYSFCSVQCRNDNRRKHRKECQKRAAEMQDEFLPLPYTSSRTAVVVVTVQFEIVDLQSSAAAATATAYLHLHMGEKIYFDVMLQQISMQWLHLGETRK